VPMTTHAVLPDGDPLRRSVPRVGRGERVTP
jgi:hypothetical protein